MAAKTTTADGNWGDGATWTGGVAPVAGDTVTLLHNVTITANIDIGSSPATGGTAAIAFSNTVTGKTLTVNEGVTVICRGDFTFASSANGAAFLVLGAGSTFTLHPASGQQYLFRVHLTDTLGYITCNGSSGSHVTIKTDLSSGGTAGYMVASTYFVSGIKLATFTDFIDMGTTANYGVRSKGVYAGAGPTDIDISLTDCTFTRSNYRVDLNVFDQWDGDYTFQRCTFSDSPVISTGVVSACAYFTCSANIISAAVWTVDTVAFDKSILLNNLDSITFSNFFVNTGTDARIDFNTSGGGTWSTNTKCINGVIYGPLDSQPFGGPIKNIYFVNTDAANPHTAAGGGAIAFTDCLFECPHASNDGAGDMVSDPTTMTGCIVLPGGNSVTSGKMVNMTNSTGAITHCTFHSTGAENGMIQTDETTSSHAGDVPACRSNLIWSATDAASGYAINATGAGTPAVDAVTLSTHNAFWNPDTGTCVHNTVTSQAGVVGYNGIKVSTAGTYPNAQVGANDITITSDPFVDKTRNLGTWGATQGGNGTYTDAAAILLANPALISTASTGLLTWVRHGFKVTGAAGAQLQNAGHDGATIGAGEFVAGGGPGGFVTMLLFDII